jgi:hypothetical protein
MSNRRRKWFLRRMVLGLAVAAVAAPVAQAKIDEGQSSQPSSGGLLAHDDKVIVGVPTAVLAGDDKVIVDVPTAVLARDDKVIVTSPAPVLARDDKVIVDVPTAVLARDDKVIVTSPAPVLARDDKVIVESPTSVPAFGVDYNQFGYRHALPQDYGITPTQVASRPDGFDWSDAGLGAGLALALMLLAAGAAAGTRRLGRPASA